MALLEDYQRVSRARRCPVCGRPDWCLVSRDDPQSPSSAVCARVESPIRFGDAGWLHRFRDDPHPRESTPRRTVAQYVAPDQAERLARFARTCSARADRARLERLSQELGLSVESLQWLQTGWATAAELEELGTCCKSSGAWTFPMVDATGQVRGIRLRAPDGYKYALRGGRQGLFVPEGLADSGPVFVAEGPTDTAALLDLGFEAIGRPSCGSGAALVTAWVRRHCRSEVAVVSDGDGPGQRGADALAKMLVAYCAAVRGLAPPEGVKDMRDWKRAGATPAEVLQAVERAPRYRVRIRCTGGRGGTGHA